MNPDALNLDALMHHAVLKRLAAGNFSAFIPCIAHRAYETGGSPDGALFRLRAAIGRDFLAVMSAWEVLGPRAEAPRDRALPHCFEG